MKNELKRTKKRLFLKIFWKKANNLKIFLYFCIDLREKSRVEDALADYFALYQSDLRNQFGISSI